MRVSVGIVVVVLIVLSSSFVIAAQTHTNVLRKTLMESPLDLWSGKPNKQFTIIESIEAGGQPGQEGMYDYVRNVLNNLMKQAIVLEADAIVDLKCSGKAYPKDHGDFFEKEPWIAIAARPIYCKGTAVKYK